MENVLSLAKIEGSFAGISLAVAAGKAVLAALEHGPVSIEDIGMDEVQWSEIVQYLARRGVTVRDNVARWTVR
jgi:hypothetical protein